MKFSALFLSSIFYLLSSAFISLPTASAQTNLATQEQTPHLEPNTNPDVPNNLHTYTQNVVIEILSAATCQLSGIDPVNPNQACLGVDQKTGKIGFVPASGEAGGGGGAIGVMGNMISMLYTPPLHTGDYFNSLAQNFGIAKKAYAQGAGFEGLKPLLGLWTAFRNIVYLLFVIVFVVIGFAIMFRVKIDPRTVMTIQNQIPKIIIGIVFVTFSYAIAGFLIDLMYGSTYLIGNVIISADKKADPALVTQIMQQTNPLAAASLLERNEKDQKPGVLGTGKGLANIAWGPAQTAGEFISPLFDNPPGRIVMGIIGGFIGSRVREGVAGAGQTATGIAQRISTVAGLGLAPFTGGTSIGVSAGINVGLSQLGRFFENVGRPAGPITYDIATRRPNIDARHIADSAGAIIGFTAAALFAKQIVSEIASLIVFIIIVIALLWALIRLWFVLIRSYIYILIDVVLAPFWIVAGLVPGNPVSFTGWIRHILASIAVFPATIVLFLLGKVFIDAFGTQNAAGQFVPPFVANPTDTNAIGAIIGLGTILLSPNVANMTFKALNAPRIDLSGVARAFGIGVGVVSSPLTTAKQIGTGAFSLALSQRLQGRLPRWLGGAPPGAGGGGAAP